MKHEPNAGTRRMVLLEPHPSLLAVRNTQCRECGCHKRRRPGRTAAWPGHELAATVRALAVHCISARRAERTLVAANERRRVGGQRSAALFTSRSHFKRHGTTAKQNWAKAAPDEPSDASSLAAFASLCG